VCGIAGIYDTLGRDNAREVDRMLHALVHRGPDGSGTFSEGPMSLGNRRLAILDPSEAAAQPMADPTGRYAITYNGEIFNYCELRDELRRAGRKFTSRGDTEVLLAALAEWGAGALHRLNGMFAFALYDRQARTLFCARDRLGVKPFVYAWDGERFAFASEHKALRAGGFGGSEPSPEAVYEYIARGYTTGGRSFFSGMHSLAPGSSVFVELRGSPRIQRWWTCPVAQGGETAPDDLAERVGELLDDSVRLRLRSDVPVGAHLSGGLDSSAVVAAAARHATGPLATFTGAMKGDPDSDERPFARAVNEKWGLVGHEIEVGHDEFAESFDRILDCLDEPVAGPGVFPQLAVCDLARRHGVKVALGGQGGDELFGGYVRYQALHDRARLGGGTVQERARALKSLSTLALREWRRLRQTRRSARDRELHPSFLASVDPAFREEIRRAPTRDAGGLMRWDLGNYLPALLHVDDRTSMAVSLESRPPLLDHRLVELVCRVPPSRHFEHGPKSLLRAAVDDWLPSVVSARTDKLGFPTPLHLWRHQPALRKLVLDLTRSRAAPVFSNTYLRRAVYLPASELWAVMMVQGWLLRMTDRRA
jgi:asparagine synthase (glutamine-hydrolysing)